MNRPKNYDRVLHCAKQNMTANQAAKYLGVAPETAKQYARSAGVTLKGVNRRGSYKGVSAPRRDLLESHEPDKRDRRLYGGCLECGADTLGRYCEAHARAAYQSQESKDHHSQVYAARYG